MLYSVWLLFGRLANACRLACYLLVFQDERYRLDRLTESHVVAKATSRCGIVVAEQPAVTVFLVFSQCCVQTLWQTVVGWLLPFVGLDAQVEVLQYLVLASVDTDSAFTVAPSEHHQWTVACQPFVGNDKPFAVRQEELLLAICQFLAHCCEGDRHTVVKVQPDVHLEPVATAGFVVSYADIADVVFPCGELFDGYSHAV